jgi:hypothetical protein
MKNILTGLLLFASVSLGAQNIIKDFFKYSTLYTSAMAASPMEAQTEYFVTQSGELNDITVQNPYDYRVTLGIRRVARYDYEPRQNRFYNGHNQSTTSLSATVGAVNGFEYLAQYDKGRQQGNEYVNQRYFLRYLAKYWMIKGEFYNQGLVNLNYTQIDTRLRLHVGEVDLSLGVAGRQHRAYGYNPIEEYLQNKQWWDLAYEYGYEDIAYSVDYDLDGEMDSYDWFWCDEFGAKVADTDADFRRYIYGDIVNNYNQTRLDSIGFLGSMSVVGGVDYYHYADNFWLHTWVNVLPWHKHIIGNHQYSYENFADKLEDTNHFIPGQWIDYTVGGVLGYKIGLNWGVFAEAEYMQYWDRNVYLVNAGINYQFR